MLWSNGVYSLVKKVAARRHGGSVLQELCKVPVCLLERHTEAERMLALRNPDTLGPGFKMNLSGLGEGGEQTEQTWRKQKVKSVGNGMPAAGS